MSDPSFNTNVEGLRPRAYQLEMLEASLKENIIVAVSFIDVPESRPG